MSALRFLFIGNSYTQRNDLPGLLADLGREAQPPLEISSERVIVNGASLRRHWNAGEAVKLLDRGKWDLVVLQEQSTLPLKNPTRYHESVRLFHQEIRQRGARTLLYQTWARRDHPETQAALTGAVQQIAQELDAEVAPVGEAWRTLREAGAAVELFDPDGSHPTLAGSYLAACVFLATLTRQSPEGLPAPTGATWAPDVTQALQQAAQAADSQRVSS